MQIFPQKIKIKSVIVEEFQQNKLNEGLQLDINEKLTINM